MNVFSVSSASTAGIAAPAPTHRGVERAPALGNRLARFGRSLWAALERAGYRRAQHHVELLGLQYPLLTERTEALRAAMERDIVAREASARSGVIGEPVGEAAGLRRAALVRSPSRG